MSNQQDYEATLPLAQAIPLEDIKTPSIPVGIYSQEAEDLHQWCQKDKEALIDAGVPENYFDLLNNNGLKNRQRLLTCATDWCMLSAMLTVTMPICWAG